jgi:hypothetical protein
MKFPQTGGCQCGAIRYEIREALHLVYTCHCTECQRLTGSAFSMALVVAGTAFQLAGTHPRPLQRKADSGRTVTRWVCPDCGTWIWSGSKPDPASGTRTARGGRATRLSAAERSALNQALAKALALRDAGKMPEAGNGPRNWSGC